MVTALDTSRHTLFKDCHLTKTSLTINLKWSKGNQLGTDIVTLPRTKETLFLPCYQLATLHQTHYDPTVFTRIGLGSFTAKQAPVFWPSRNDVRALHGFVWEMANLTAAAYTPHSLRRGGATFFAESGLPLEDIQRLGLWRSDAIKFYPKRLNFSHSLLFKFLQDL